MKDEEKLFVSPRIEYLYQRGYDKMTVKDWLKEKLEISIQQLNEESHRSFQHARPDQLGTENDRPGGFCWKRWDAFVGAYKEGDEIWYFDSPDWTWRCLAGRRGYAIVREGEVVTSYCTELN